MSSLIRNVAASRVHVAGSKDGGCGNRHAAMPPRLLTGTSRQISGTPSAALLGVGRKETREKKPRAKSVNVKNNAERNRSQGVENNSLLTLHRNRTSNCYHYHHRLFSDTRSIEITIKQHRGQTGNIQKYTQKDISVVVYV